ncbi:MAG: glycerol kinase GlpK [Alcaligenaceae bacterium]|nr:glycerol kinase GlpK [Alcaligenaceae bacterium]
MFITLDQGTTSARTLIFNDHGHVVTTAQMPTQLETPHTSWVEQNPEHLLQVQLDTLYEAMRQAKCFGYDKFVGIGITNQRETTIIWDKTTGKAIYPAIIWQDRRTLEWCRTFKKEQAKRIKKITGLRIDPYFSAGKIKWILDHVEGAYDKALRGELAFGTIDTWLIWHLTGGDHVTDVSNASRTMLMDLHTQSWSEELLDLFDIPLSLMPKIVSSGQAIAQTLPEVTGGQSLTIFSTLGDQQSALFGHDCIKNGMAKCTYGTGCFLLLNTEDKVHPSAHDLLSTVAWQIEDQPTQYALEGSVFMGGAIVQWLRDQLGIIQHSHEVEALAKTVPNNGGVVMIPAFAGLGTPYWRPDVLASIHGLGRDTHKGHIARASLESIAFRVYELLNCMEQDTLHPLSILKVDGGASKNDLLMQFQADILGVPVLRSSNSEVTAMGVAKMMALVNKTHTPDDVRAWWSLDRIFEPKMTEEERKAYLFQWRQVMTSIL